MIGLIRRCITPVNGIEVAGQVIMPTLARLVFAGTLLMYFWNAAGTKLAGLFTLDFGSYAQIFPKKFEAVGYDPSAMSAFDSLVVYAGTYAEYILPALIVLGLFTRLAALGMIGFIVVQSLTDIYGHMIDEKTLGVWFDRFSDSLIIDQRSFWVFLLLYLFFAGAGALSMDRLIGGRES
ncbi:MAG: DoxX family protein [Pseudomonadota bacterium]